MCVVPQTWDGQLMGEGEVCTTPSLNSSSLSALRNETCLFSKRWAAYHHLSPVFMGPLHPHPRKLWAFLSQHSQPRLVPGFSHRRRTSVGPTNAHLTPPPFHFLPAITCDVGHTAGSPMAVFCGCCLSLFHSDNTAPGPCATSAFMWRAVLMASAWLSSSFFHSNCEDLP